MVLGSMATQTSGGEHVEQVITQVQKEFQALVRQRAAIIKRIGAIKQTIAGLAKLFGDEVLTEELMGLIDRGQDHRQPGFTWTCRVVLRESARPLGAREVCEQIKLRNPALLARHRDPLASVTTVLNRLASYGEARFILTDRGGRTWQSVTDSHAAATDQDPNIRHSVSEEA